MRGYISKDFFKLICCILIVNVVGEKMDVINKLFDNIKANRLNYRKHNPLSKDKSYHFPISISDSMDPRRISWNSLSKFVDKFKQ